jgi:hypothetical protein
VRTPPLVTAIALLLASAACHEATSPAASATTPPPRAAIDAYLKFDGIDNGQMRGNEGSIDFGHFQLVFYAQGACLAPGVCFPPNPCQGTALAGAPDGFTALGVCATVFNPGGETFTAASLVQVGTTDAATVLTLGAPGAYPTDPCRSLTVQGVVYVANAVASRMLAYPGSYRLSFASTAHPTSALSGALDGSTTGAAGPISETDTYFAYNKCTVDVTAR